MFEGLDFGMDGRARKPKALRTVKTGILTEMQLNTHPKNKRVLF